MHRRQFLAGVSTALVSASVVATTRAQTPAATPTGATREITHPRGVTAISATPQGVLALGEQWLLADLLELGITPIASTSTFATQYVGVDPALTEGLEPFSIYDADLEWFTELQPDLILVPDPYIDIAPDLFETIGQIAPLIPYPQTSVWQDDFRFLASLFSLTDLANEKIAALEAEITSTATELALSGQTVSYATIYAENTDVAIWLTDLNPIVEVGIALGLTVVPDAADFDYDHNGRVTVSLEQAGVLTGETLIVMQATNGLDPNEEARFAEVTSSPIWQTIPAVQNDRVVPIERVGYPGDITGRHNLLTRYREIFG